MFSKKTIKDVDVRGKRVLVRVDFNVPIDGESVVDDTRVRAAMPTLRYLVDHGARVIIASHLGRPNGAPDLKYSLKPVRRTLAAAARPQRRSSRPRPSGRRRPSPSSA